MNGTRRIKATLGTIWAILAIPIVLLTFIGMNALAPRLVSSTGLAINPRYTGGMVERTIYRRSHRTRIHAPVFAALVGQGRTGFVQVDFARQDSASVLPATIEEDVDLDEDGTPDFHVSAETGPGTARIDGRDPRVLGLDETIRLDDGFAVRVRMKRDR